MYKNSWSKSVVRLSITNNAGWDAAGQKNLSYFSLLYRGIYVMYVPKHAEIGMWHFLSLSSKIYIRLFEVPKSRNIHRYTYFYDKHLSRFSGWFELPNKYYLVVSSSIRKNAKNRGKFTTPSIKLKCQKTAKKKIHIIIFSISLKEILWYYDQFFEYF